MRNLLPWLAVVLAAYLGISQNLTPAPAPLDAPRGTFSGSRAHALVERLADRPHLIGTQANALVRDRIVAELEGLGLDVQTRRTAVVYDHPLREERRTRAAWPENIIATLPGDGTRRGPGEALLLMTHYDSVGTGHGAADAMSGVASIIESLRALRAGGTTLERDLIVLITDGEEIGLMGAQAFFREDPLRELAGLVLNFEARGGAGPASMFQTGPDNAGWVREFGRAAVRPDASSVSVEVYRRMPNDTDATITLEADIPFLNFAFIDDYYRYHAGADMPANLSLGSLQHEGDNLLALIRHFGSIAWPESASDATYFSLGGSFFLSYGEGVALAVSVLAGLLAVLALVRLGRAGRWFEPLLGAAFVLATLAIGLGIASTLYGAARASTPSFHLFYQYHELLIAWIGAAFLALALAASTPTTRRVGLAALVPVVVVPAYFAGVGGVPLVALLAGATVLAIPGKQLQAARLLGGALLLWLLLLVAVAAIALHAAYLFAWPLAAAGAAVLWSVRDQSDEPRESWLPLLVALPLWLSLIYGLYLGLAITMPGIVSALVVLLLALAFPVLAQPLPRNVLSVLGLVALLAVPWAVARDPFTPRFPQPVEVFLAQDLDSGDRWWMSRGEEQNELETAALGGEPEAFDFAEWGGGPSREAWRSAVSQPEPALSAAPAIVDARLAQSGSGWRLEISIVPTLAGARMMFELPPADYTAGELDGIAVPLPKLGGDAWSWDLWGISPAHPIRITVDGAGEAPQTVRFDELRYGTLPSAGLAPRPEDAMARPWSLDRGVWLRRMIGLN